VVEGGIIIPGRKEGMKKSTVKRGCAVWIIRRKERHPGERGRGLKKKQRTSKFGAALETERENDPAVSSRPN